MKVDQHLVHFRTMEGVEPEVEQRRASNRQQALRGVIRDRPQPAAGPRREQERLHGATLRTTPSERMLAVAASRIPSIPSMSSSHSA